MGSADGGQFGDAVRLGAELAAGRDELGGAGAAASGGAGRRGRRALVQVAGVGLLRRRPSPASPPTPAAMSITASASLQQLHALLLGAGDLRRGPRT